MSFQYEVRVRGRLSRTLASEFEELALAARVAPVERRLFGSFVDETEEPRYGIIKPIQSYNPLWINTHGWHEMWVAMRERKSLAAKFRCIFASPNMELKGQAH